jgi:hypothetical protein
LVRKLFARKQEGGWTPEVDAPLRIPSLGGGEGLRSLHRSAGVGFRINNPHQVVNYGPKTPLKSPLVQGGDAVFIERGAALGDMKNSSEDHFRFN